MFLSPRQFLCVFSLSLFVLGCGGATEDKWTKDRPKTFPAKGVVLKDGQPVEGATINFFSVDGKSSPYAMTNAQGAFVLSTFAQNDGAPAGQYKVTITKKEVQTQPHPTHPETEPPKVIKVTWHVPEKYSLSNKTPLEATITEGKPADFKFEVKE